MKKANIKQKPNDIVGPWTGTHTLSSLNSIKQYSLLIYNLLNSTKYYLVIQKNLFKY